MRLLGKTEIDFLGLRYIGAALSGLAILVTIFSLVIQGGPRFGIDFTGGSQVIVQFAELPDLDALRAALEAAGIEEPQIQEFAAGAANADVLIRTPQGAEGEDSELLTGIRGALDTLLDEGPTNGLDLNTISRDVLGTRLLDANPLEFDTVVDLESAQAEYGRIANSVLTVRDQSGLLGSWDPVTATNLDPRVTSWLQSNFYFGGYAVVGQEFVGPQVGQDLRRQGLLAMGWALVGLLAYISYRFEFRYGVGAVAALVHDVIIAVGAFSVTGREFNLPVVAAFLTIVGYSLNDTVVVFDRIRENSTLFRRMDLRERINLSINQTLSRTVLTSGTTLAVVLSLFLYGGPVINNFAFALLVGVIVGTYSSIFVAGPVYYWLAERAAAAKKAARKK